MGNLAIEETVDVKHAGAQLKGSFSRYEYQRESSGVSSVKNSRLCCQLPPRMSTIEMILVTSPPAEGDGGCCRAGPGGRGSLCLEAGRLIMLLDIMFPSYEYLIIRETIMC